MRFASLLPLVLLVAPTLTFADTILVGTDLSTATGAGGILCPGAANCTDRASQFTLSTSVTIDSISVVVSAPALPPGSMDGTFTIGLGSQLGVGITSGIGTGSILITPKGDITTQEFTFSGLDLTLAAGTYYLGMAGGNVEWNYAQPVSTTAGTLGLQLSCDPALTCGSDITRWDKLPTQTYAMEIDGTPAPPPAVPEPSSIALLGSGVVGLAGVLRRRFFSQP
jgi:hypothetical protein